MYLLLDSYIKAADPSNFVEVIKISVMLASMMIDFIHFLQTARKSLCEPRIDPELAYVYAKANRLHDVEVS